MSTYTPGPWEAIHATNRERTIKGRIFTKDTGPLIAAVQTSWEDAQLIAAAPEMLAFLRAIPKGSIYEPEIEALIAKAEGRTP